MNSLSISVVSSYFSRKLYQKSCSEMTLAIRIRSEIADADARMILDGWVEKFTFWSTVRK